MNRASNGSHIGSLSTPTATRSWGSQRPIELEKQLYQRAETALARLRQIPGFDEYEALAQRPAAELPAHLQYTLDVTPAGRPIDPVSVVFRVLRMGAPLSLAFNALNTPTMLDVLSPDECRDLKLVKRAIYRFCEACVQDLQYKWDADLFTISQVFHESISELLRPLATLEALLHRFSPALPAQRASQPPEPSASDDQLAKVCHELLQTERKYVQDLELLLVYHDEMMKIGIPRETADRITPHIARLLDFHRRFLVGCEYQARQPQQQQNFGWLFLHLSTDFEICKVYTLSQKEATRTALLETSNLMPLAHIFEPTYELPATLLKPVQRIMRYPLLLKEIAKNTPSAWPNHNDLLVALDAMHEMMTDVNETQRRAENSFIRSELEERVKDWRGLDLASMGELLLSGSFPVAADGEQEQECALYLFERVLLCCRDRQIAKKTPLTKMRTRSSQGRSLSLDVKGRIYLEYITQVQTTKLPSGWRLRLSWGLPATAEQGTFDMRLANEELTQMWESSVQRQVGASKERYARGSQTATSPHRFSQSGGAWSKWISTPAGAIEDESGAIRGALFYEEATSPMDALRKLSVSSTSSQQTLGSLGSRGSYPSVALAQRGSREQRQRLSDAPSVASDGQRKVRIHVKDDAFLILVPPDVSFDQLQTRVERKLRLCGKMPPGSPQLAFTYRDEDDDLVKLETDDDLLIALDSVPASYELSIHVQ